MEFKDHFPRKKAVSLRITWDGRKEGDLTVIESTLCCRAVMGKDSPQSYCCKSLLTPTKNSGREMQKAHGIIDGARETEQSCCEGRIQPGKERGTNGSPRARAAQVPAV